MNRKLKRVFMVSALAALIAPSIYAAAPVTGAISMPKESSASGIIVKFKDQNSRLQVLGLLDGRSGLPNKNEPLFALGSLAGGVSLSYNRPMALGSDVIKLAPGTSMKNAEEIAQRLAAQSNVEFAVVDRVAQIMATPNDTRYNQQWHYHAVSATNYGLNLPSAWDITTGNPAVVVAVLDTGITVHEDLNPARILPGYDFLTDLTQANDGDGRDNNPADPGDCTNSANCSSSWHGTHVAGTIGANTNNALGVSGVNWQSKILPVRVLGVGGGAYSDIIDGMVWASGGTVPNVPPNPTPAKVLNLSLGGQGACDLAMQAAVSTALANGSVVVVAAGNSNLDAANFSPASCNGVITVAATGQTGQKAYYSNFGRSIEIAAPGGDRYIDAMVLSTLNAGITSPGASSYASYQGTSMAAPHVAGLVSLMLSINPSLTAAQILTLLQQNATPFPASGTCTTANCGAGIANAGATLAAMGSNPPPPGDTQPNPFGWPTKSGVNTNTWITSDPIVLTGFDTPAPFSVDNGYLILNCTPTDPKPPRIFSGSDDLTPSVDLSSGTVNPGTSVCVKHMSSSSANTTVTSTVTVGGVNGTFKSVTKQSFSFFPR